MAGDNAVEKPLADAAFLRFLLPATKSAPAPTPSAPPALLAAPHRLLAAPTLLLPGPRPDERLFIVPPTRPSWLPPAPPPPPPPHSPPRPRRPPPRHFPGGAEPRTRNVGRPAFPVSADPRNRYAGGRNDPIGRNVGAFAGNGGWAGFERRRVGGRGLAGRGYEGEAGAGTRRAAARRESKMGAQGLFGATNGGEARAATKKEKKVWVALEKKGENAISDVEDQAAAGGGYAGGDEADGSVEAEEQLELEEEKDGEGRLLGQELETSLLIAGDLDFHDDDGGERPSEQVISQSNRVQRLRARMGRQWVECRHDIDTFTSSLLSLYESLKPSDEHKSKQSQLIDSLTKSVSKEWPNAQLHLYGSCANSFGTSHSDVDICLQIDIGDESVAEVLLRLAEVLQTDNFDNVEAITSARVPIVRMLDSETGFSCDICINNIFAVANTKLLRDYAQIDGRLLQLAFLVKHWAKLRSVNETYRGTLSSYAYVLMCISFLQLRDPKILPCLQAMEPTYNMVVDDTECAYFDEVNQLHDFGAENKESIAELLWAFFHYWAYHHDYRHDVISIRMGKTISKTEKNWTTRVGNDRHLMCIEDPFETSHDLGRVVDRQTIRIIREEFERAAAVLQSDDDPCATLFEPYNYQP